MKLATTEEPIPDFTGDFYAVLGVSKDAKKVDIVKAYRRLVMKYHPDRCKVEDKDKFKLEFEAIQKAYETLGDVKKRGFYDRTGIPAFTEVEIEKAASSLVSNRIIAVCNDVCSDSNPTTPEQLSRFDLVSHVRKSFQTDLSNNEKGQSNIKKVSKKLSVVIARLSKKDSVFSTTTVGTVLLKSKKDVDLALGKAENDHVVILRAIEMSKEYDYEIEAVPPPATYSSGYKLNIA